MRAAIRIICACSVSAMNGSAISSATKIARIFGTKTSVISWICVSAWNSEMATPTARPDQHQRAGDDHQREDRVARHIENFRSGHSSVLFAARACRVQTDQIGIFMISS